MVGQLFVIIARFEKEFCKYYSQTNDDLISILAFLRLLSICGNKIYQIKIWKRLCIDLILKISSNYQHMLNNAQAVIF